MFLTTRSQVYECVGFFVLSSVVGFLLLMKKVVSLINFRQLYDYEHRRASGASSIFPLCRLQNIICYSLIVLMKFYLVVFNNFGVFPNFIPRLKCSVL